MKLGEMEVCDGLPPKLLKASAVISSTLHQAFSVEPWIEHAEKSKESCVLCSLTVRGFLYEIGFTDARVRTCCTIMAAWRDGVQLHSLGVGSPEDNRRDDRRWCGHMVCEVPSANCIIDTTLYQARRPAWPDMPPMIVCETADGAAPGPFGLTPFAGVSFKNEEDPGYECSILWLDRKMNDWRQAGDARERWRRHNVIRSMVERFGNWKDGD